MWPWESHLNPLSLSSSIHEVGIIKLPHSFEITRVRASAVSGTQRKGHRGSKNPVSRHLKVAAQLGRNGREQDYEGAPGAAGNTEQGGHCLRVVPPNAEGAEGLARGFQGAPLSEVAFQMGFHKP